MDWYSSDGTQKVGPVSDEAFLEMVCSGAIGPETMIWNSQFPDGIPYGQVPGVETPDVCSEALGPEDSYCTECGLSFPVDDLVRFGDRWACATCKGSFDEEKLWQDATTKETAPYAGFWIRWCAYLVDGMICFAIYYGIVVLAEWKWPLPSLGWQLHDYHKGHWGDMFSGSGIPDLTFPSLLAFAVQACYEAFFVSRFGATPGKMAAGMKVVMRDGGRISLGRAFGRYFAKILSHLILQIGYIMIMDDAEKRGLHDRICGTRVIETTLKSRWPLAGGQGTGSA